MFVAIKLRSIAVVLVIVVLCMAGMLIPSAAYADHEYGIGYTRDRAQPGEAISIQPGYGGHCPAGFVSDVDAVFTDSASNEWVTRLATTNSSGQWYSGIMFVNPAAAYGSALVSVRCSATGMTDAYPFEDIYFTVTEQSDEVVIDRAQIGMTTTFSSAPGQGCGLYDEGVSMAIYGTTRNYFGTNGPALYPIKSVSGDMDAYGDWEFEVILDDAFFDANTKYFARIECWYGGHDEYNSFQFIPRWNEYVAMGDSFSSGEGSFNYNLAGGACHRSTDSYPYYLVDNLSFDLPDFAACSGAVTDDLYAANPANGEEAQLNHLNEYTEQVTITIGGNDVGFVDAVEACANYIGHVGYSCASDTDLTDPIEERLDALAGTAVGMVYAPGGNKVVHPLSTVLTSIATAAPNAEIYVAGYPYLFGASNTNYDYDGDAPGAHTCTVTNGPGPVVKYAFWDAEWLNDMADALNQVIEDAVDDVQPLNVTYVSPSEFDGHGLCDNYTPYLNGVEIGGLNAIQSESLHPNVAGMQFGYGAAFEDAID